MTHFTLPYGYTHLAFTLPDDMPVQLIEPEYIPPAPDPLKVVRDALASPVDGRPLASYLPRDRDARVAIAINDKTRPVPHEHLLPPLLQELHQAGVSAGAITFYIATGTHLPMGPDEYHRILPEDICHTYQVVSHNCDDETNLLDLGVTRRGTRILGNKRFLSADLKIVVGNIEPHHFAGFSGGYKTAAIGLTARQTINHNHAMLVDPYARIAELQRNPLRQDIEEIGDALGVQFALNAILNGDKRIVQAVSGSPRAVISQGIPLSRSACQINLPGSRDFDLVIASVGGAPKDINFYQSQKALSHASLFTRDGGVIILVAACPEGSGSRAYETFMEGIDSVQGVFDRFQCEGFRVGPHKAFQVARDVARVKIILVSQMDPALVQRLLLTPAGDLGEALILAELLLGKPLPHVRAAVLPRATNTIPVTE